jgi:subtilase family serine protease
MRIRALTAAVAVAALVVPASAGAASSRSLSGSVPGWAKASAKQAHAAGADGVGFRVYLGWRDASGAEALAKAVSTPGGASYGKFLSPAQFRQRYAPAAADVNAVKTWLKDSGFSIVATPLNGHYVDAEGTVAEAEAAFATTLNTYAVDGRTLRAPATALRVPASLTAVAGVIGLDESQLLIHPDRAGTDAAPSAGFRNGTPCSAYWAEKYATDQPAFNGKTEPYAPCGYTPSQLQGAYGVAGPIAAGNDGSGQTVAVIDAFASPTIVDDVNTYSAKHGLPAFKANQFSQVVAPGTYRHPESRKFDPSGWYGEETLDVEAVHSMAPGANITYVGAPNNGSSLDAALNHVVDRKLAQIVTNSYGFSSELLPPGYIKPYNDTFIQAAIEGIGLYFSSGDNGDELNNVGYQTTDWPASSPYVTAVGGTSLGVDAGNGYAFETGWGTKRYSLAGGAWTAPTYLYGAGGGTSRLFAEPSWQKPVVPADIATRWSAAGGRAVPDVAMVGDPTTGMLVGQTQTFSDGTYYDEYRIGGTSLSSPLFAGVMALADQAKGSAHGFASPALYEKAGTGAFRDIAGGPPAPADPSKGWDAAVRSDYVNGESAADGMRTTLRTLDDTGNTIKVRPGYDDVTGVGSPAGQAFLDALK